MALYEQSAYLLHSRPYQEHQLIVELLTENEGKVSAIVYPGKTQKSNKKALLQPFLPLKVTLKGNSNLKYLSRIESIEKSFGLKGNYLYSGFYVNEMLVRLLGKDIACNDLFLQYHQCLSQLSVGESIENTLRQFELCLLDELGLCFDFSPVFESEANSFYYLAEQGFVPAFDKMALPCYSRLHLQAIAQQELYEKSVRQSYKVLMRQVFSHLLGNKPLNSRKLFIPKPLENTNKS